jgi:hypothetical protein
MTDLTPNAAGLTFQGFAPSVTIHSRTYFSISHFVAAANFSRQARKIERMESFEESQKIRYFGEHRGYVSSAVLLSVAFLEAAINELFSDCAANVEVVVKQLPAARDMALLWKHGVPKTAKYRVIDKYDKALEICGKPKLNTKSDLVRDFELLVRLRNALMHYEPESILTYKSGKREQNEIHSFETAFKGKFQENPLTGDSNAFYPDKLLGHGCAWWAVKTSLEFYLNFCKNLKITPNFEHGRHLVTDSDEDDRDQA